MASELLFGILPEHWELLPLGEVCARGGGDIQTGPFGSQLHASDYVQQGVPSIMPQNIGDNRVSTDSIARITEKYAERLARYRVKKGDVVYSRRGDVERRALIRESESGWLCGTGCLRIRFGESGVDPLYASQYLGDPRVRSWVVRHAHGATMPNLNTSILSELPFVVPPRDEQQRIAEVLGTLDDKIELNRKMNETLEAMAQALFKSWFVDFDPVRAKAEGRDPGLPAPIAALFPHSFEESPLGPIPAGWPVLNLGELIELAYGKALREQDRIAGQVAVYGSNGQIGWHYERLAPGPGIIVGRKGNPGIVIWAATDFFSIDTTFYVIPKGAVKSLCFLFFALKAQHLGSLGADSAVPGLNRNLAYLSKQLVPPSSLLAVFEQEIQSLFKRIQHGNVESVTLRAMRDTLLPKLVSGEVRLVPHDEALI